MVKGGTPCDCCVLTTNAQTPPFATPSQNVVALDNPYVQFAIATALLWGVTLGMAYLGSSLLDRAKGKEWRIVR